MSETVIPSEPQPRRKFKVGDQVAWRNPENGAGYSNRIVTQAEDDTGMFYYRCQGLVRDDHGVAIDFVLVKAVDEAQLEPKPDLVNHPPHYTSSVNGIECIDAIAAALTPEEFRGFCKGNAIKYTFREQHKGGAEDLKKAQWYLARLTKEGTE